MRSFQTKYLELSYSKKSYQTAVKFHVKSEIFPLPWHLSFDWFSDNPASKLTPKPYDTFTQTSVLWLVGPCYIYIHEQKPVFSLVCVSRLAVLSGRLWRYSGQYDHSVDVYAFGVLLWYILSNDVRMPDVYEQCDNKNELWKCVKRGETARRQSTARRDDRGHIVPGLWPADLPDVACC